MSDDFEPGGPGTCKACQRRILWVESKSTGRMMPLDIEPRPDGNLAVVRGVAHAFGSEDKRLCRDRYVSHFATCPRADSFRKAKS